MNISGVNVELTGNDLASIINEFVKVEGLAIYNIILDEDIKICGSYKVGVKVDFEASIRVGRIENGKIYAEVTSFKLLKIGIISLVRKMAIKYVAKNFEKIGLYYDKGKLIINVKKILVDIPYIDFDIASVYLNDSYLNVEVRNVNISLAGTLIKEVVEEDIVNEEEEKALTVVNKVKDNYSFGRGYIKNRLPEKAKGFSDYIFLIPDMVALIYRLLKDRRVPLRTKLIISGSLAYISCPKDIIPDKIPFIGKIDEIAVAFFALDRIIEDVPVHIILENWEGENDIILVVNKIIEYVINFTNARNVEKLYSFLNEICSI